MGQGVVVGVWGSLWVLVLSAACSGKTGTENSRGDDGGSSGTAAGGSAGKAAGGANGASGSVGSDGFGGSNVSFGGGPGTGASAGVAGYSGAGAVGGIAGAGAFGGIAGAGAGGSGEAGVAGSGQGGIGGSMPDASLVGTWIGYVENHQFTSGSDEVRIEITDGAPSGHVVFGNGTPPPPPNPDVGYPPSNAGGAAGAGAAPGYDVYEGFRYTVFAGNVTGDRVRFKVESHELWQEWCSLQTPVPLDDGSSGYGCVANWGYASDGTRCWQQDPRTGAERVIDCGKLQLCTSQVCECTAQSCKASGRSSTVFDMDHKGNELDGSANGLFGLHNVRLTKQE